MHSLPPNSLLRRQLRTLPFHMTLQGMLWMSSEAGLQQAKSGSDSLKQSYEPFARMFPLLPSPALPDPEALASAVREELARQNESLLKGAQSYLSHPYQREATPSVIAYQQGNCRLLDYGADGTENAAVFFIPSLINRHYILDLMPGRSWVAWLKKRGIRAFVMDWGDPGAEEVGFTSSDYVTQRLIPALSAVRQQTIAPVFIGGYCMGGLLALALAQLTSEHIAGLALLATPWDFHAPGFPRVAMDEERIGKLDELLSRSPTVSGDIIQTIFYASNPWVFTRKFSAFADISPTSAEAQDFMGMESWVNDGVDMASPVARECLIDWGQRNKPFRGQWQVAGKTVDPASLNLPVFAACPRHDNVVPPDCAEPLLKSLPHASLCRPISGHIGMVAGVQAEQELWQPFALWINSHILPQ